jgi:hypothetical protein
MLSGLGGGTMIIGTMFLGKVESLGGHCVRTKFFLLGIPLFPIRSMYVIAREGTGFRGVEIPTHGMSVVAAYARIFCAAPAGIGTVLAFSGDASSPAGWAFAGISVLVWSASMWGIGRLSAAEKRRREILLQITGLGLPPDRMSKELREDTAARLQQRWVEMTASQDWRAEVERGMAKPELLPLLYALCAYARDSRAAEIVLQRIDAWKAPTP